MVRRLGVILSSRRRGRLGAGLALVAGGLVVAAIVLRTNPPSKRATGSQGHAAGTATVQRRDLVETDTESGTVGYANPQTVYNRLSGTITWLPAVGQVIRPGERLFGIDGQPVTLMDGSAPAYRDLTGSDSPGVDIEELNRDLVRLGFDPDGIVLDDQWQPATTAGVDLFQESLGQRETGSLSLGQVVFLPGKQVISAQDGTVGSTGGGGGGSAGGGSAQNADTLVDAGEAEFVGFQGTTYPQDSTPGVAATRGSGRSAPTTAHKPRRWTPRDSGGELSKLTALLKAEAAQLRAATGALRAAKQSSSSGSSGASRSSSSHSSRSGSGAGATAILETSSTQLIVTVGLSASSQREAKVGARVTVQLPSGQTVNGTITAVSSVAQSSSNGAGGGAANGAGSGGGGGSGSSGSTSTVPVTIKLKSHHSGAGLDQASVSVNFTQAEARHVLSVPVTALIATVGGAYAVQEADAPYRLLPVRTGLFAAGDVQISGAGVDPGLRVTNSQG